MNQGHMQITLATTITPHNVTCKQVKNPVEIITSAMAQLSNSHGGNHEDGIKDTFNYTFDALCVYNQFDGPTKIGCELNGNLKAGAFYDFGKFYELF